MWQIKLLDCLNEIIEICQKAKYPEDLEDVYDVLDKYVPSWKDVPSWKGEK